MQAFVTGQNAVVVVGHSAFGLNAANDGGGAFASAQSLWDPFGVSLSSGGLFVGEGGNRRVSIRTSEPSTHGSSAVLALGQPDLMANQTNQGGAMNAGTLGVPAGVWSDGTRIVVADSTNNRVLIYNSLSASGQAADVVVGSASMLSSYVGIAADRFSNPTGIASDGTRLIVSEWGNNRVLIFNSFPSANAAVANVVLGQATFSTGSINRGGAVGAGTMNRAYSVSYDGTRLAVGDQDNHRVLLWNSLPTVNGQPADVVIGQPDFTSNLSNRGGAVGPLTLVLPGGVLLAAGKLFIADTGNNRVLVFNSPPTAPNTAPDAVLGQADFNSSGGGTGANKLAGPRHLSYHNGHLAVADTSNHRIVIYYQPTPSPTATRTWTATPVVSPTPSPTISPFFSPTQSPVVSPTPTRSPGGWVSPTRTFVRTVTRTLTPIPTEALSGVDLDVTYIERLPRYKRYRVAYTMVQSPVGIPGLVAGSEGDKHWPDVGEAMTWVGHVRNMGSGTAGAFDYRWRLGATVLDSGTVAAGLASGAEVTVSLARPFPASAETLVLEVDHDGLVDEDSEINNSLEAGSHDLVMKIWVEQGLYDLFRGGNNLMGTRSFEDWIQAQFVAFNLQAQDAVYTTAPSGIHDRIRIDAIAILPQLDPGNFPINASLDKDFFDGHWSFSDRDMSHAAYFAAFRYGIDWGLLHELAHQVGMIDLYVLNLDNDPANNNRFYVKDRHGVQIPSAALPLYAYGQIIWPAPGLMGGGDVGPAGDTRDFCSWDAAAMNTHQGHRRGFYGEALFDIPDQVSLRVMDAWDQPVVGAVLSLYQKDASTRAFDDTPEHVLVSDATGTVVLPNRPVTGVTTITGHTLKPNPWGQVYVVGTNGTFFIRVEHCGNESFHFFTLTQANEAYWAGQTSAFTHVLTINQPAGCSGSPTVSPSPGTPSMTASPSVTRTVTLSSTPTRTATPSASPSGTSTLTATPSISATGTATTTLTSTSTATPTTLPSASPTPTPTTGAPSAGEEGLELAGLPTPWRAGQTAWIWFTQKQPGTSRLSVYNLAGQRVAELAAESRGPGPHQVPFELPRGMASGVYVIVLDAPQQRALRKVVLLP